jgi:hypothetical protein
MPLFFFREAPLANFFDAEAEAQGADVPGSGSGSGIGSGVGRVRGSAAVGHEVVVSTVFEKKVQVSGLSMTGRDGKWAGELTGPDGHLSRAVYQCRFRRATVSQLGVMLSGIRCGCELPDRPDRQIWMSGAACRGDSGRYGATLEA